MRWNEVVGSHFGSYDVREEIGQGSISRVYRAYDIDHKRSVALKLTPIFGDTDERATTLLRLNREMRILQRLSHPNIAPIYDVGSVADCFYQASMLLEGPSLRQRIANGMYPYQAALFVMQAAHALHYAHIAGIIHAGVKPSDMLFPSNQSSRLLLTGFGKTQMSDVQDRACTRFAMGTSAYMAPEQIEGHTTDPRSDIYALGCVLYEALAGRPPFVGSTPLSVLYQHVHARPTDIRNYNPAVSPELWTVMRTCLSKRPEDRFPTAERLAAELWPFATGLNTASPQSWEKRKRRP